MSEQTAPVVRDVTVTITYRITMTDPMVWRRPVENIDGWRDHFYDLTTIQDVAEHLAWNLGIRGDRLSNLDGFADLPDNAATAEMVGDVDYE